MIVELSRTVSIYISLWIFEYFLTWKNSFFKNRCQNPGRYAQVKPFIFYSMKAEWKLHFEFKSYDHFFRQTNFPDFSWRLQRHGYSIWNFLWCPVSLPSFIIMAFLKLGLEGRWQYDPFPEKIRVNRRLGNMGLRRSRITTIFFPMLSLFSRK